MGNMQRTSLHGCRLVGDALLQRDLLGRELLVQRCEFGAALAELYTAALSP
jgi:hypothetical protein